MLVTIDHVKNVDEEDCELEAGDLVVRKRWVRFHPTFFYLFEGRRRKYSRLKNLIKRLELEKECSNL